MSVMDPGLRDELLAMAAADQDARQRLDCHRLPQVREALRRSKVVADFGHGTERVEIRKLQGSPL